MSQKIVAFGELLWDILPDQTILGGAPFNFAFRTNSLGNNGIFVSRVGQDKRGNDAIADMKKLDINTGFLQRDAKHATGTVDISFDENHMPDFIINPGAAYDFIELTADLISATQSADCLYFGTLIQRAPASRETLRQLIEHSPGAFKFLDINLRKKCYTPQTISWSLQQADALKLNDDEILLLADIFNMKFSSIEEFCIFAIKNWKLQYCVVTCGDKGAYVHAAEGNHFYEPGYQIELIDSVGSGDAFSAGFVHKILNGADVQSACYFGNMLGALTATTPGATTPISLSDIANFESQNQKRIYHPEFSQGDR